MIFITIFTGIIKKYTYFQIDKIRQHVIQKANTGEQERFQAIYDKIAASDLISNEVNIIFAETKIQLFTNCNLS